MALHPGNKRLNVPYWWPLWVIFETTKLSGKTEDQQEDHFTQVMVKGIRQSGRQLPFLCVAMVIAPLEENGWIEHIALCNTEEWFPWLLTSVL